MKIHMLKLREEYADAVLSGEKSFEVRFNDRGYQKGDHVKFTVVTADAIAVPHPLDREVFEITYVLHGWGLSNNWCVFAIRRIE